MRAGGGKDDGAPESADAADKDVVVIAAAAAAAAAAARAPLVRGVAVAERVREDAPRIKLGKSVGGDAEAKMRARPASRRRRVGVGRRLAVEKDAADGRLKRALGCA